MKRSFAIVMCAVCFSTFWGCAACAEQIPLAELKQQIPERLQMAVTAEDGKMIEVDAPIVVPEGDVLPIVLCKCATFDTATLRDKYPLIEGMPSYVRIADAAWNYEGSPLISYHVGSESALYGKTDYSTRHWLPIGETPPENSMTVEEAMDIVRSRIAEFEGDTTADIRPYRVAVRGGLYRMKMVRFTDADSGVSYRIPDIDPQKPIKKGSKGTWEIQLTQHVKGIQIFPDCYMPSAEAYTDGIYWPTPVWGNIAIMDEELMALNLNFLSEQQVLQEDVLLASFESVQEAVRQRMESGQLKSIYRLTLGYSVIAVEGDIDTRDPNELNLDARYVLVPTWQVCGYDLKNRISRMYQGYTEPDEQTIMQSIYGPFELRFDAVTAKPLVYFEYTLDDI